MSALGGSVLIMNDDSRVYMADQPQDLAASLAADPTSGGGALLLPGPGLRELPSTSVVRVEGASPCLVCDVHPAPTADHVMGNNTCEARDGCGASEAAADLPGLQVRASLPARGRWAAA